MNKKKPMIKESVGSQHYAFNKMDDNGNFKLGEYEEVITTDTVKKIGVTENGDSQTVKSSGIDYETINEVESVDLAVEEVAVDDDDLARMRGETIDDSGLILTPVKQNRPFFAYGKVVKLYGGGFRYDWYPKCQLIENTDDIETQGENFSEQNDTLTIRAYKFDNKNVKVSVRSGSSKFPEGMTEEKFFKSVIYSPETLKAALTEEATNVDEA